MALQPASSRRPRCLGTSVLLLAVAALPGSAVAQEEAGVEEGRPHHRIGFGFEAWVVQPAGLEYTPAVELTPGTNNLSGIDQTFGTETDGRYTLSFNLENDLGSISAIYFATSTDTELARFSPGNFIYGEVLAPATAAGVLDDGLADTFQSPTHTSLRDNQLLFSRTAFNTPKVNGTWSIGWRRVEHRRYQEATYFAAVSPLPPSPTPRPILDPRPDFAEVRSEFDGRGLTGGIDVGFNLWRDRLLFESSMALAVMRGDIETGYSSLTHFYACGIAPPGVDPSVCPAGAVLGVDVPFDVLAEIVPGATNPVEVASFVTQLDVPLNLNTSKSVTSMAADLTAGFRWRVLEWLDARVGFRQSRYTDVGLDLRPVGFGVELFQQLDEAPRDATYEGFFFGVVFEVF